MIDKRMRRKGKFLLNSNVNLPNPLQGSTGRFEENVPSDTRTQLKFLSNIAELVEFEVFGHKVLVARSPKLFTGIENAGEYPSGLILGD